MAVHVGLVEPLVRLVVEAATAAADRDDRTRDRSSMSTMENNHVDDETAESVLWILIALATGRCRPRNDNGPESVLEKGQLKVTSQLHATANQRSWLGVYGYGIGCMAYTVVAVVVVTKYAI